MVIALIFPPPPPMPPRHISWLFRIMAQNYAAAHDEFLKAQLAGLPLLPAVERLSSTVIRILGGNPGKVLPLSYIYPLHPSPKYIYPLTPPPPLSAPC